MQSKLNPYISFRDNARQALEFYQTVFGGKLNVMTFGDARMSEDPAEADKVMHGQLEAENGMTLMASDTPKVMAYTPGSSISISLTGDNLPELKGYFEGLSAGGTITVPFATAPWGDTFGMFVDKFGVNWMVNIIAKK
jgi:PhnB protein